MTCASMHKNDTVNTHGGKCVDSIRSRYIVKYACGSKAEQLVYWTGKDVKSYQLLGDNAFMRRMKRSVPLLVYADTSAYGGVFDDEFFGASERFFAAVRCGSFQLAVSEIVHREINYAPEEVKSLFQELLPLSQGLPLSIEATTLQQAYITEGVVSAKSSEDALHVALATVSGCDLIVSWNFKHIVNFQKIPLFNAVNILQGYHSIMIYSPLEVIDYET